ncbi:DUF1573 domain-containing protein [Bacteroides congonensis]|uniref:DUF1573 domain-containing protein n=1 Tax=Bacteroides congonensis TaxID=1871006 RepID=UPI003A83ED17
MKLMFAGLLLVALCISCKNSNKDSITRLVNEWKDKKILIPSHFSLISYGDSLMREDSISRKDYTIVTYVDSLGCISCKLQLDKWKDFIHELDSIAKDKTSYLFVFHPKKRDNKELIDLLQRARFMYPVFIDSNDSFNKLNHFSNDIMFQTFLIDKENTIIAIGNPIHNPKIKELYMNIIFGKQETFGAEERKYTKIMIDKKYMDLGTFDWKKQKSCEFILSNIGQELLVVDNVITSCGCTTVEYSKVPVQPEKSLILKVKYVAEHPEYFNKTVTVYCNEKHSPIQLKISGNAE